ncbi:AAA-domain-containing protein, partial [Corynespora cassiicola Philippines]
ARLIRRRRYPLPSRSRSFHSTRFLAQDPNLPSSSDNTPIDPNGASKNRDKVAVADQPGPEAEDAEVLAQKLQRSRELARRYSSALRRSQRRNRAQDLPPVHIPDWFLKRRVTRREERPPAVMLPGRQSFALTISPPETGDQATLSYSASSWSDGVESLSQLVRAMWREGLDDDLRKVFADELSKRVGAQESENLVKALQAEGKEKQNDPKEEASVQERIQGLHDLWLRSKSQSPSILPTAPVASLAIAEIRAHIVASLSAVRPSIHDTYPSTKTNLILHSPCPAHERKVRAALMTIADELNSDIIELDAQALAQIGGDYIGEGSEPSPYSIRSLGYETYRLSSEFDGFEEPMRDDMQDEEVEATAGQPPSSDPKKLGVPILAVAPALVKSLFPNLQNMQFSGNGQAESASTANEQPRQQTQAEIQLEEMKLTALLESLLDANELKRSRGIRSVPNSLAVQSSENPSTANSKREKPKFFDFSLATEGAEVDLSEALPHELGVGTSLTIKVGSSGRSPKFPPKSKIVYIKDIKELNATQYGGRIIQKLEDIVRKQRSAGESIILVGTTCSEDLTPELSATGVRDLQADGEAGYFRTIVVPMDMEPSQVMPERTTGGMGRSSMEKVKFRRVNLLHIQDMLRSLDPSASENISDLDLTSQYARKLGPMLPQLLSSRVLTYDEVHRIALTALGLHLSDPINPQLSWTHVALAMGLLKASDEIKFAFVRQVRRGSASLKDINETLDTPPGYNSNKGTWSHKGQEHSSQGHQKPSRSFQDKLKRISASATKHEKKLMPGIADPDQIKTTFDQVHVPKETLDAIRTLTSLSLLRPDAFDYGVLATEKISGSLLYGPPGTGKTLLAKAVAKESGSTVLEVSGSQIMDKYVGEGEKNVTAVFSLARKLSPCIVFLDEADAILATRDAGHERTSHRDILNQFLKEWDGLNDLSVFVMVATNRPFDLDDAVIRRLPRRLLVDLPTQEDRREILKIHLRGEQLDESVDLEELSKRTPFYSGSDLKNLAVSAALACVKEENEQAAIAAAKAATEAPETDHKHTQQNLGSASSSPLLFPGDQKYEFPERRILYARHFEKALEDITASISEDMSSLTAIKKFDEQYGDKKGKRKKNPYGFGINAQSNENTARVR